MRALAVAAAAIWLACGVDVRSTSFECTSQADCTGGRTCSNGWCVEEVTSPQPDVQLVCDPACSNCVGATCVIDCTAPNACSSQVTCPGAGPCRVDCGGSGSCAGGVDCGNASICTVNCIGDSACAQAIDCGPGRCDVTCSGDSSCSGGIECSGSCACDTNCSGANACSTAPSCLPPGPCSQGGDCRSGPGACDSC